MRRVALVALALALLCTTLRVPLTHKPPTQADSAPPLPPWVEALMMRLIESDSLFWSALHMARDQVITVVLATPAELGQHASALFIRFDEGGHAWVGHDDVVLAAIVELVSPMARP